MSIYPTLLAIGQATGMVVAVAQPPTSVTEPITTYELQRATDPEGSWTTVDTRAPSSLSNWVNLFDPSPLFGTRAYYQVVDDFGDQSNIVYFQAVENPPVETAAAISPAAFGPYPLLGSDVFLNPATGEGVIGPNGDLLSVNGLYLLAQDLRIRLLTTQGELLLHTDYGMGRQRLIGSGQGDPVAQAQLLQTQIIGILELDPRVDHIEDVAITQVAMDAWTVTVTLVAIGAEDAGLMNLVFPYFLGS
jgi:hypothetical protein